MSIHDIIEDKKAWRAHMARVKALPPDYQMVYREIQKYFFKVGPAGLTEKDDGLLRGIVELFEEGAASGKGVLEVTGRDVAAFCDDLIEGVPTYEDLYQPPVDIAVAKSMKKAADKAKEKAKKRQGGPSQ